jgi:hypothetical protein
MFTRGGKEPARAALNRSFAIAEEHDDVLEQLRLLGPLNMFSLRTRDFNAALHYAKRCSVIAGTTEDSTAAALAHSILGISLHLDGDLKNARTELEAAMEPGRGSQRSSTIYLGFEGRSLAGAILARNLWLQGHPAQAAERARQTINDAARMEHALTLSIVLIWGISTFLWIGDLESAEAHLDWLISNSESHSLAPYLEVGRGFRGEVAIRRGHAKDGVESLQDCLRKLHAMPYELLTTPLDIALIQGLAATGRFIEAVTLIDETIKLVEENGDTVYMPELLRLKANLLLSIPTPNPSDVEMYFMQSLDLSHRQGAQAWELRAATDLATLWTNQGRTESARALLQPVFEQFVEGFDTKDLEVAERLLATLP